MIGRAITELAIGQTAELTRHVTLRMITDFAETIGDENPVHSDKRFAKSVKFEEPIAPGILSAGLISAAIGTLLPGPGTLYMSQDLRFLKPVFAGDTITVHLEVVELVTDRNRARLKTVCVNQRGDEVLAGEAWVKPPRERIVYDEEPSRIGTPLPVVAAASVMQLWSGMARAMLMTWRHGAAT